MKDIIDRDLLLMRRLKPVLRSQFRRVDFDSITEEICEHMRLECDYRQEASNQKYFAEVFRDHPRIKVPKV